MGKIIGRKTWIHQSYNSGCKDIGCGEQAETKTACSPADGEQADVHQASS